MWKIGQILINETVFDRFCYVGEVVQLKETTAICTVKILNTLFPVHLSASQKELEAKGWALPPRKAKA